MENEARETIGERVRERRNELGYSLRQAAEASGINYKTWARIERGESGPTRGSTRNAICDLLEWKRGTFENPEEIEHMPLQERMDVMEAELERMGAAIADLTKFFRVIAEQASSSETLTEAGSEGD